MNVLGFEWDADAVDTAARQLQFSTVPRVLARYYSSLPEFVFNAAKLEGSPYTLPEVQTLLDGVTVGGYKVTDERLVLNLVAAYRRLDGYVRSNSFVLNKQVSDELNGDVATGEALEAGHFRGEGVEHNFSARVFLGDGDYHYAPVTEPGGGNLLGLYEQGVEYIEDLDISVPLKAQLYFCFGALNQFYFDGNKRTSMLMMNGYLLSNCYDGVSVPNSRRGEWNKNLNQFYRTKNATGMIQFLSFNSVS